MLLAATAALAPTFIGGRNEVPQKPCLTTRNVQLTGSTREVEPGMPEFDDSCMNQYWWQKSTYLTEHGYRENPVRMAGRGKNKKLYMQVCREIDLGMCEANLIEDLKERGMTIEAIRAKASVYEFKVKPGFKLTEKMTFLLQVKALHSGETEELIDLQDQIDNSPAPRTRSGVPGAMWYLDSDRQGADKKLFG